MNNKNKYSIYIINLLLVLIIFLTCLYICKIYPFGNKSLAISDGIYQFEPFLYDFIIKIKKGMFTLYSFNNGLGNPIVFNYIYYLSSPLNFIAILFNKPDNMYFSVILVKLLITSITMTKYAKSKTYNKVYITIATLSYVFSSWLITYYFYISWLDVFMIFPLIIYGIDKMMKEKNCSCFILSLSYSIITNFYLSFSVYIYITLYFLYHIYLCNKKDRKNYLIIFIKSNILVGLVSFFFLFLYYDTFKRTGLYFDSIHNTYTTNIKLILSSIIYGNNSLITSHFGESFPNIACNLIITINIFLYLFSNNKISKKIGVILTILLIIFIFYSPSINYLLNMFHNIRGYTYRYSFLIIFLQIQFFLNNIKNFNFKRFNNKLAGIISLFLFLILIIYERRINNISFNILYLNVVILISFLVYIIFYNQKKYYNYILLFLSVIETIFGICIILYDAPKNISKPNLYYNKNHIYRNNGNKIKQFEINYDKDINSNENLNLYVNDKTVNLHTSVTYNNVVYLLSKLGEVTNNNSYINLCKHNEFANMLLNVSNERYMEKIFSINKDIKKVHLSNTNIKDNLNKIASAISNENNIFKSETVIGNKETNYYRYDHYSLFYIVKYKDNNNDINYDISQSIYYYLEINKYNKRIIVYDYDDEKLNKIYEELKNNQIKYSYYNDDHIKGNIKVDKEQLIFTSIPYDTNWKIYLDGKRVKPIKLLDSLIGIEAREGKHTLEMKYSNNNLIIPFIISVISLLYVIRKKI